MCNEKICKKCFRKLKIEDFYYSNNLEKYPDGYLDICKKCITIHVDDSNPDTFLWILKEVDVPYLPYIWAKYFYNRYYEKAIGTYCYVTSRYLCYMTADIFKDLRWKDQPLVSFTPPIMEHIYQRFPNPEKIKQKLTNINFDNLEDGE